MTGEVTAVASLKADGTTTLAIGEKQTTAKREGLIPSTPKDGLVVGGDDAAPVGPYEKAVPFKGAIESVELLLGTR